MSPGPEPALLRDERKRSEAKQLAEIFRSAVLRVLAMVCSPKTTRRLLTLWLWMLGASGCSDDDAAVGPPRGPKDLSIAQVSGIANSVSSPGETLTIACNEPLLVWIAPSIDGKLGDFTLEPPGKCGDETNCGWIKLTVPGTDVVIESARTPLRVDLPSSIFSASPSELSPVPVQFHAELRTADGEVVMTDANQPLAADLLVNLATTSPCDGSTAPSVDASSTAPSSDAASTP